MSHYIHLTIEERETLYLLFNQGVSIRKIAAELNRSPSTIRRELKRNTLFWQETTGTHLTEISPFKECE